MLIVDTSITNARIDTDRREPGLIIKTWHKWANITPWVDRISGNKIDIIVEWSGERAMYRRATSVRWSQYSKRMLINTIGLDGIDDDLLCKEDNWYDG